MHKIGKEKRGKNKRRLLKGSSVSVKIGLKDIAYIFLQLCSLGSNVLSPVDERKREYGKVEKKALNIFQWFVPMKRTNLLLQNVLKALGRLDYHPNRLLR